MASNLRGAWEQVPARRPPERISLEARSSKMKRVAVLVLAGSLLALTGASGTSPAVVQADTRPNIVVIETDDQTLDSLRYMANVDRLLVKQGVKFEKSFSSYPLCCPSRATLLTGQYAHNHGVLGNAPPLGGYVALDHTNTLPVWLGRAGYHTAFVGKYLNGYGDGDLRTVVPPGWAEWRAATRTPGRPTLSYRGFTMNENGALVTYAPTEENYQSDVFTRKAVEVINGRALDGAPFFLWLSYFAPHGGLPHDPDDIPAPGVELSPSPAARHNNAFAAETLPRPSSFNEVNVSDKPREVRKKPRFTASQVLAMQDAHQQRLESLLAVDEGVAQVVAALRATGKLANTLIVFTSDNGLLQGEHRVMPDGGKGVVYEPSVRVPLVIRGPNLPRGRRVTDIVSNVDLVPTFLALSKATPGRVLDGRSLLPLARDRLEDYGRDLLLQSPKFTAIRTNRYVYVTYRKGAEELYDLKTDPNQLRSRHADPALRSIREELARRLFVLDTCFGALCREEPRVSLRLAALAGRSVRAGVSGADTPWVDVAQFYVDGKRVAKDFRAPFDVTLPASLFSSRAATIRAHVTTTDGRGVTKTSKVPLRP